MKRRRSGQRIGTFQLVEESAQLVRNAPLEAWAIYLSGILPFAVGLLWFWVEESRSALAFENLLRNSGLLTLLFLWKQATEALHIGRLRAELTGSPVGMSAGRILWIALRQAAVQSTAIVMQPLAAIAGVPLAHTLLFYRQAGVAAVDGAPLGKAWESARYAIGSAWVAIVLVGSAGLLLYGNLLAAVVVIFQLGSSFFGWESVYGTPRALLMNGTVHFAIALTVYVCTDVALNACAALQAFYGSSVRSGEDLLAAMRRPVAAVLCLFAFALMATMPVRAETAPKELNAAIDRTLEKPEFAWRTAAKQTDKAPAAVGWLVDMMAKVRDWLDRMAEAISRWLDRKDQEDLEKPSKEGPPALSLRALMIGLAVVAAVGIVWTVVVSRKQRRKKVGEATDDDQPVVIDLRDEAVLATAVEQDEWLRMADDFRVRGELRLALRALHLACLRMLNERGRISVARWKSGMDYVSEARRRSADNRGLVAPFQDNVRLFELGWYSRHPVEPAMLDAYRERIEEIRTHAA